MVQKKTAKIQLDVWGEYLGFEDGCFFKRDRWSEVKKYPFMEQQVSEVTLRTGNTVSTGALATLASWNIDVTIMSPNRRPVAVLRNLEDDSHVKTRVSQYNALTTEKGINCARQFVLNKIAGQKKVLKKYGIAIKEPPNITELNGDLTQVRKKFISVEGNHTKDYYKYMFNLFPEGIRVKTRTGYKAYDGLNNIFNLGYEMLKWRVHRAIINAKLEPYLGFLHSMQFGKPSLVCDFQELYRYIIDDFIITYCQKLRKKDFIKKSEYISKNKIGIRIYPNDLITDDFMDNINLLFEKMVNVPRVKIGNKQPLGNMINEEAHIFAQYLRDDRKTWVPRIPELN